VSIWPLPFNPADGALNIEIVSRDPDSIAGWSISVREPVYPYGVFYERSGEGAPPGLLTWDGLGESGALVQSAMSYPIVITITTADGEEIVVFRNYVAVDVLVAVTEDGGLLRIIVPAIIFGPDRGDFVGVAPSVRENNERVLARIAEILNRFEDYSIVVEGHANPVAAPGTALRAEEEEGSPRILGLRPLSQARAETVLEYLVSLGVDRSRLSAVGAGGTRVIVPFEERDYWWQNRRVEFILER